MNTGSSGQTLRFAELTARAAKPFVVACFLAVFMLLPVTAYAQTTTYTADWDDLGLGDEDAVISGSFVNAGPNRITVDWTAPPDTAGFAAEFGDDFVSYDTNVIGGVINDYISLGFDNDAYDSSEVIELIFTLDTAAEQLTFTLGDVDRRTFEDAIEIEYDTGDNIWRNINTNSSFYTLGVDVDEATNTYVDGFIGTENVSSNSTDGNIAVDFGTTTVKRVRIRYFSGEAVTGNPSRQLLGISDFTFQHDISDLSLTKTVSNPTPASGTAISYQLNLSNAAGSIAESNVEVRDNLPIGFDFTSATGFGTYDETTGIWTVPSIAAGQTRTITINGTISAPNATTVTNFAEIISQTNLDDDSTPDNGSTTEDDDASVSFTTTGTRTAGTPPTLVCPIGNTIFDWNTRAWTSGATNTSYTVTGIGSINFALSTNGTFVAPSPDDTTNNTGGFGGTEQALYQFLEFTTQSQTATTVLTLPTAVPGLQFVILDVDFAANDFADKFTVTGSFNGTTVLPVMTNGVANYVVGNIAIGDAGSGSTSADGNVWVTFDQPVDTVTIEYGNHTTAPADPDGQAASIYDFNFCNPQTSFSVTKISQVLNDPFNGTTNPKAIPGATMQYCLLMTNSGSGTAGAVTATDDLTGQPFTYIAESMRSGSNCGSAATVEDDDATAEGGDESDPFGASITSDIITAIAANLGPAESFALTFQVTVD